MKALFLGFTVAVIATWLYVDYRERRQISTSEWLERMRKHGLGVR